jgi:putative ABC transport system substrate-binding protein
MAAARLDCMIANGEPHARFLQEASRAIPTVVDVPDPVGLEFAKSLARPGGNVTGLHDGREAVSIKTAELFKRLVPKLSCIAWIGAENFRRSGDALEAAAKSIGLRFHAIGIRDESASEADRIGREIASMRKQGCLAGEVGLAGDLFESIVRHAVANRIALSGGRSGRGVLFSLWTERLPEEESTRRIPAIAARVLRGERPADIPFEGPSRYFLTLNLQVAAQVGVTVPDDVVLLANRVIR